MFQSQVMAERERITDEIRRAVAESDLKRVEISRRCGISQALLSRFMHETSGIASGTLDRLAGVLDLHVVVGSPGKRRRASQARRGK